MNGLGRAYRIVCHREHREHFELTADSMLELELRRLAVGAHFERLGWALGPAEPVSGERNVLQSPRQGTA